MPGHDKRDLIPEAQRLFVEDGLSLAQIADIVRVSHSTLERWSSDHEWRRLRLDHVRSYRGATARLADILSTKIDELAGIPAGDITPGQVDVITKLASNLDKLQRRADLPTSVSVAFKEFLPFLRQNAPEIYEKLDKSGLFDRFLEYVWGKR